MYKKRPTDPWFSELKKNPIEYLWMYESWRQDHEDRNEFQKSFSIFLGSFFNPEAAKKMMEVSSPNHESTDEDFERSLEMVKEDKKKKEEAGNKKHRRQRRVII